MIIPLFVNKGKIFVCQKLGSILDLMRIFVWSNFKRRIHKMFLMLKACIVNCRVVILARARASRKGGWCGFLPALLSVGVGPP